MWTFGNGVSGVGIVVRNNFTCVQWSESLLNGRLGVALLSINNESIVLANLYAPSERGDREEFYVSCQREITAFIDATEVNGNGDSHVVVTGDFNCVMDVQRDRSGIVSTHIEAGQHALGAMMIALGVDDPWPRVKPDAPGFTWSPAIAQFDEDHRDHEHAGFYAREAGGRQRKRVNYREQDSDEDEEEPSKLQNVDNHDFDDERSHASADSERLVRRCLE
jgi:exonuclease III